MQKMRRARRVEQPKFGAQVAFKRVSIGAMALGALAVGATAIGAALLNIEERGIASSVAHVVEKKGAA